MLYDAYEVQRSFLAGASKWAGLGAGWLNNPSNPWGYSSAGPIVAASLEVFAHASAPRGKPEFGIHETRVGRKDAPVEEEILLRKPFGQLKHFAKEGARSPMRGQKRRRTGNETGETRTSPRFPLGHGARHLKPAKPPPAKVSL